jgi:hypothetical protein
MHISKELRSLLIDLNQIIVFLPGLHDAHFIQCPPEPTEVEYARLSDLLIKGADLIKGSSRSSGRQRMSLRPPRLVVDDAHRHRSRHSSLFAPLTRGPRRPGAFH